MGHLNMQEQHCKALLSAVIRIKFSLLADVTVGFWQSLVAGSIAV